jgi:hypothetical protein
MDGDGDLDVVTTEQIEQLGIVWYENPLSPTLTDAGMPDAAMNCECP